MQSLSLSVVTTLVNISAGFSDPEIFNKDKCPSFINSLIKWYLNWICLHLEWKTGFLARLIVLWLSLNIEALCFSFPNSLRKFFSQTISLAASEITMYSTSARGGGYHVEETHTWGGDVLSTSVRWNHTSGRSGKIDHHISEENTHKPEP